MLIAITTCTDRKKFPVPYELTASHLPSGPQPTVTAAWRARIRAARPLCSASGLYSGRSFQEALLAARAGRADFRVISGGLGLVRGDEQIPSYSLSLVRESSEFIGTRVIGEPFDVTRWWSEVQRSDQPAPLAELVHANPTAMAVIGISKAYLSLIAKDLLSLEDLLPMR